MGEFDFSPIALGQSSPISGLNLSGASALTGVGATSTASPLYDFSSTTPISLSSISDLSIPKSAQLSSSLTGSTGGATNPQAGLGLNIPTLQLGLGALNSIGGLYAAFQSQALAKKQFNLQKQAYDQNVTNNITSYNTALEDKARSRGVMEGQTDQEVSDYIDSHKLTKNS